jgi:hypothetical protein
MAVLTDGREWSFFLPGEEGAYHERCVYKLDLIARPVVESTKIFERYLKHEEVDSGRALENAKSDYRNVKRTRKMKDALPEAWRQILRDKDELLLELIAERVATICGFKPELEVVEDFIQTLNTAPPSPQPPGSLGQTAGATQPPTTPRTNDLSPAEPHFSGFSFNGQRYNERSAIGTLIRVLEVLSKRDPNFLERYAALPRHGGKRRFLSRNKMELYPGRPDLCNEHSVSQFGGWWIGTNYNRSTIRYAIELACQVAGLQFGTDLKLI